MSSKSPYRRNTNIKRDISPIKNSYLQTPSAFNDTFNKSNHHAFHHAKNAPQDSYNHNPTEKKNMSQYELQSLFDNNKVLTKENRDLYNMLKQRGQIITALEKKLQQQINRQVTTLEAIELERNKFVKDSQKKFKEYQRKIQELIRQNYRLSQENHQQNIIKAQQIDLIKATFTKEQFEKINQCKSIHETTKQATEYQLRKVEAKLKRRDHQLQELQQLYQTQEQKLKNEIIGLNDELVHLAHMKKIQISDQKIAFENMIDHLKREHLKEKQIMTIQSDITIKKLEKELADRDIEVNHLGQLQKIQKIEQNVRQQELLHKKDKLEAQISELQDFYKQKVFNETQQLKQQNKDYLSVLQTGNQALKSSLNKQIANLTHINKAKTDEINKLLSQIANQRQQFNKTNKHLQNVIQEMKQKMNILQEQMNQETQILKSKWAQLSQADIKALKNFYQSQIQGLQQQLDQKSNVANNNIKKLHQELQQKNEMRKRFDLETLNLNKRISQLQFKINQLLMMKKEGDTSMNAAVNMTNSKLLRQTTQKQKITLTNEGEKRKLQQLINAKDKEINELNQKIKIMRQNYSKQVAQKNAEIEIIKKHNEDFQAQLKKQKIFYDTQVKKKDSILKNEKAYHEEEITHLKKRFKEEFDSTVSDLTRKIGKLEVQVNHYRDIEKKLKNEIEYLNQERTTTMNDKKDEIELTKSIHINQKKSNEDRLKKHYADEIQKLQVNINDLKKQLSLKEQDLRQKDQNIHKLQQKLDSVMKSQQELRSLENKVLYLGQQNNLVKNYVDINKKDRKE